MAMTTVVALTTIKVTGYIRAALWPANCARATRMHRAEGSKIIDCITIIAPAITVGGMGSHVGTPVTRGPPAAVPNGLCHGDSSCLGS